MNKKPNFALRLTSLSVMLAITTAAHALPDLPIYLKEPVPPNVFMTLDDSGSMAWAYAPDGISGTTGTRRYHSWEFNSLAYNPNTVYRAPLQSNGTAFTTSFTSAFIDGTRPTFSGSVNLGTSYRAISQIVPGLSVATQTQTGVAAEAAYYYKFQSGGTCVDFQTSGTTEACYVKIVVGSTADVGVFTTTADKQQNFANWYSFYRTRNLLVKSSLMLAMAEIDPNMRVGWQAMNSCQGVSTAGAANCSDVQNATYFNGVRPFSGTHRDNFYSWIQNSRASGGTPLQAATNRTQTYFTNDGNFSPWNDVSGSSTNKNACRLSYHVLLTDGIWNGGTSGGERDDTSRTLPDGRAYSPQAPYQSASAGNTADQAFNLWATDLQPGMPNNAPHYSTTGNATDPTTWSTAEYFNPRNDPATWQHLVTYTIGLGLGNTLRSPNPAWFGSTFASNTANTDGYTRWESGTGWPATGNDASPGNVYDLWHAAINGRGEFYSAATSEDIYRAFQSILARITARSGSAGSVSTTSAYVFTDSLAYQSSFRSADWSGSVYGKQLTANGSLGTEVWNTDNTLTNKLWTARNLYMRQTATASDPNPAVVAMDWSQLNAASKVDLKNEKTVNWLRGDRSHEMGHTSCITDCTLRKRTQILGDVLGSSPVVSWRQDFGYKNEAWAMAPGSGDASNKYHTYLEAKKTKTPAVLVGSNSGFVHVFNGSTGDELFGYAPGPLNSKLWRLTEQVYVKKNFVDGPITIGDAFIGNQWKTYAVGTLGAGGKSVYALDITNPNSMDANSVKWEYSNPNLLGHVLSKPTITRLPNGTWVALFSGGYETTSNQSTLFMLDLATGAQMAALTIPSNLNACGASVPTSAPRGLGEPRAFTTKDGKFYVYAGDLNGNVWRYEWSATGALIASYSAPFFKACRSNVSQPITAAPRVTSFGVSPYVYFGTGRFYDAGDTALTTVNSMYAVIDDEQATPTADDRTKLMQQQVVLSGSSRVIQSSAISQSNNMVTKRGWYLDLPTTGERIIATPLSLNSAHVAFTTFIPATEGCESKGNSWLMMVDSISGANPAIPVFTQADGTGGTANVGGQQVPIAGKAIAATVGGLSAVQTSDVRSNVAGAASGCGSASIALLSANVYDPGYSLSCTPGQTFRTGWRNVR